MYLIFPKNNFNNNRIGKSEDLGRIKNLIFFILS